MTTIYAVRDEARRSLRTNPVAAALGATDLYVEWLRKELPEVHYDGPLQTAAVLLSIPRRTIEFGLDMTRRTIVEYEHLGDRGEKLAKRINRQAATRRMVKQAGDSVAAGKASVTAYLKAAEEIEHSSEASVAAALKETRRAATTIYRTFAGQARHDWDEVAGAAKYSRSRAKASVTSAGKMVRSGTQAAFDAADKVGD